VLNYFYSGYARNEDNKRACEFCGIVQTDDPIRSAQDLNNVLEDIRQTNSFPITYAVILVALNLL
jgi:hypothetical protein